MAEAYIIDAVRTPIGRKKGALAGLHPADLAALPIRALITRTGIDPAAVDDVVWGCTDTIGAQAGDIARTAWLVAGMPEAVPGVTVDRQCGSSQQAVHFAAQGVLSGTQDLVVAGGSQAMNQIPIMAAMFAGREYGFDSPFLSSPGWLARYGDEDHGWFKSEIVPAGDFAVDETVRGNSTLAGLAALKTVREGGIITAGIASQNCDAAACLLIASEQAVKTHRLKPRARIHHLSVRAANPVWMLTGPIPATIHALKKARMRVADIDLFECNEAFASIPMAWMQELDVPHEKVNVQGGAIALGHPIGATGARIMTSLLNALERTGKRYGLQTMCEGGGQANVTIIERL